MKNKIILLLTILSLFLAHSALASTETAQSFIKNVSDSALNIMEGDKSAPLKQLSLAKLFVNSVDIEWVGRFSVGRYWQSFNDAQRKEYQTNFKKFLINQYVNRFRNYNHETYNIAKVIPEEKDKYLVYTVIRSDDKNISVNYKIHPDKSGNYKIYDVVVEGISLLNTHRSEFSSILSHGDTASFLASLAQKANDPNSTMMSQK